MKLIFKFIVVLLPLYLILVFIAFAKFGDLSYYRFNFQVWFSQLESLKLDSNSLVDNFVSFFSTNISSLKDFISSSFTNVSYSPINSLSDFFNNIGVFFQQFSLVAQLLFKFFVFGWQALFQLIYFLFNYLFILLKFVYQLFQVLFSTDAWSRVL